jgi:hypothetical protein
MSLPKSLAGLTAAGVLLAASGAQADPFAEQGTFAFGVERVFGFYLAERTLDNNLEERKEESKGFSFAMSGYPLVPYQLPRVGIDYFVIDGLSIGGSIGFASQDVDSSRFDKRNNRPDFDDSFERNTFLFHPRVGYAVMFGDVIGIWPRGGITYVSSSDDDTRFNNQRREVDESEFALTAEFHLIISPIEHVGITVGPVIDFGLTGKRENRNPNDPDYDLRQRNIGLFSVGLFGWI